MILSSSGFSQAKVQNYNILTRSGIIRMDPLPAPSPVTPLPGEVMEGQFFRLIQFWETPGESQKSAWELQGIRFLSYIPHHAYLVSVPANMDLSMLSAQGVRAVGVLNNEIKINKVNELKTIFEKQNLNNLKDLSFEMKPKSTKIKLDDGEESVKGVGVTA